MPGTSPVRSYLPSGRALTQEQDWTRRGECDGYAQLSCPSGRLMAGNEAALAGNHRRNHMEVWASFEDRLESITDKKFF